MQAAKYLRSFSWWTPGVDSARHVRYFPTLGASVTSRQCKPYCSSVQRPQCDSPLVGSYIKSDYDQMHSQKMSEIHMKLRNFNTDDADKPDSLRHNDKLFKYVEIYQNFIDYVSYFPDHVLSINEWDRFVSEVAQLKPQQKAVLNFRMFYHLGQLERVELARSFMEYLKTKGEISVVVQLQFLSIIVSKYPEIAIREYERLKSSDYITYINKHICKVLTFTLCITSEWKQSIELCENLLKWNKSSGESEFCFPMQFIVLTALCRGDLNTYAELTQKYGEAFLNTGFPSKVFILWQMGTIPLDSLFEILKHSSATLSSAESLEVENYIRKKHPSWSVSKRTVDRNRGTCNGCQTKLPVTFLSESEFQEMKINLKEKIFSPANIFRRSHPKEHSKFESFMATHGPFDVVMDGLNIIHRKLDVIKRIKNFLKKYKKPRILIVTRKNAAFESIFGPDVKIYNVGHNSDDDVIMLLAAFESGSHCVILSGDNYRDHKALLDKKVQGTFERWQYHRQFCVSENHLPSCYDPVPAEDKHGWHIPIEYFQQSAYFVKSDSFLCVRRGKEKMESSDHLQRLRAAMRIKERKTELLPRHHMV